MNNLIENPPYMEVPVSWAKDILTYICKINDMLDEYDLPHDEIQYLDVKEKFGRLRIYISSKSILSDEISVDEQKIIEEVLLRAEELMLECEVFVNDKIRKGEL